MKGFFPHNAVEYYVSYYDYYQPEAYIASTDTYIEKDLGHQRRPRQAPTRRHLHAPLRTQRRGGRFVGELHLRYG